MEFLNKDLLKTMATTGSGVANSLASPAVVGTGIAGLTAVGLWKLLKDTKSKNQGIIETSNTLNTQKTSISGRLKSQVAPIDRYLENYGQNSYQKAVLFLLSRGPSIKDSGKSKSDINSPGNLKKLWHQLSYGLNPLGQALGFMMTGIVPNSFKKIHGLSTDTNKEKKEKKDAISVTSRTYGTNNTTSRRVQPGYIRTVLANVDSPLEALVRIGTATHDAIIAGLMESMAMRKAMGVNRLPGYSETLAKDQSWLGKIARGTGKGAKAVTNLPGLNAIKNIGGLTAGIIKSPLKAMNAIGSFADTLINKFKGFLSGGLFNAQTEDDLIRLSKRKTYDYIRDGGLAGTLSSVSFTLEKMHIVGIKQLDVLELIAGKSVGRQELKKLDDRGQFYHDSTTGAMTPLSGLRESRLTMYRDVFAQSAFGRARLAMKAMRHPIQAWKRSSSEDLEFEKQYAATMLGKTAGIKLEARARVGGRRGDDDYEQRLLAFVGEEGIGQNRKTLEKLAQKKVLEERISSPSENIGGVGDIRKIMGERGRLEEHSMTLGQRFIKKTGGLSAAAALGVGVIAALTGGAGLAGAGLMAGGGLGAGLGIKGLFDKLLRRKQREIIGHREQTETSAGMVHIIADSTSELLESNNLLPKGNLPTVSPSSGKPSLGGVAGATATDYGMTGAILLRGFSAIESQLTNVGGGIRRDLVINRNDSIIYLTDINDTLNNIHQIGLDYKELINDISSNTSPVVDELKNITSNIQQLNTGNQARHRSLVDVFMSGGQSSFIDIMVKHLETLAGGTILPSPTIPTNHQKLIEQYDNVTRIGRMHSGGQVPGKPGDEKLAVLEAGEIVKSNISINKDEKRELERQELVEQSTETLGDSDSKTPAKRKGTIHSYLREIWEKATGQKKKDGEESSSILDGVLGGAAVAATATTAVKALGLGSGGKNKKGGKKGGKKGKKSLTSKILKGTGVLAIAETVKDLLFGGKDGSKKKKSFISRILFGSDVEKGKQSFLKGLSGKKGLLPAASKVGSAVISKALMPFFVGYAGMEGWQNADLITNNVNPTLMQKFSASASNILSYISWGLVSAQEIYDISISIEKYVGKNISSALANLDLNKMGGNMIKGISFVHNWQSPQDIIGGNDPNPSTLEKMGAVTAGLMSFALGGIVDAKTLYDAGDGARLLMRDVYQKYVKDNSTINEIKGFISYSWNQNSININERMKAMAGSSAPGFFQSVAGTVAMLAQEMGFVDDEKKFYDSMTLSVPLDQVQSPMLRTMTQLRDIINDTDEDSFLKSLLGKNYKHYVSVKDFFGDLRKKTEESKDKRSLVSGTAEVPLDAKAQADLDRRNAEREASQKRIDKITNQRKSERENAKQIEDEFDNEKSRIRKESREKQEKQDKLEATPKYKEQQRKKLTERRKTSPFRDGLITSGYKATREFFNPQDSKSSEPSYLRNTYNNTRDYLRNTYDKYFPSPTSSMTKTEVTEAIQKASKDKNFSNLDYLMTVAQQESTLGTHKNMGPKGIFQMGNDAWLDAFGMKDYKSKDRSDPYTNTVGAINLHNMYKPTLPSEFKDNETAWYILHFLGSGDGIKFLKGLSDKPEQPLDSIKLSNINRILKHPANKALLGNKDTPLSKIYASINSTLSKQASTINVKDVFSDDSLGGSWFSNAQKIAKEETPKIFNGLLNYAESKMPKFQYGGKVPNPAWADENQDSVLAKLTPGEIVLPKTLSNDITEFFANRIFKRSNRLSRLDEGEIPKFERGGKAGDETDEQRTIRIDKAAQSRRDRIDELKKKNAGRTIDGRSVPYWVKDPESWVAHKKKLKKDDEKWKKDLKKRQDASTKQDLLRRELMEEESKNTPQWDGVTEAPLTDDDKKFFEGSSLPLGVFSDGKDFSRSDAITTNTGNRVSSSKWKDEKVITRSVLSGSKQVTPTELAEIKGGKFNKSDEDINKENKRIAPTLPKPVGTKEEHKGYVNAVTKLAEAKNKALQAAKTDAEKAEINKRYNYIESRAAKEYKNSPSDFEGNSLIKRITSIFKQDSNQQTSGSRTSWNTESFKPQKSKVLPQTFSEQATSVSEGIGKIGKKSPIDGIVKLVKSAVKGVGDNLSGMGKSVGNGFSSAASRIFNPKTHMPDLGDVLDFGNDIENSEIGNKLKNVATTMHKRVNRIQEGIGDVGDKLKKPFEELHKSTEEQIGFSSTPKTVSANRTEEHNKKQVPQPPPQVTVNTPPQSKDPLSKYELPFGDDINYLLNIALRGTIDAANKAFGAFVQGEGVAGSLIV